jgi:Ser-tRNA(Ala) deacylase AlaX
VILHLPKFHPQGGGQPSDVGTITNTDGTVVFTVKKVLKNGDVVHHFGTFENEGFTFQSHEKLKLHLDEKSRLLHASIHSAGHLLDLAVKNAGFKWTPGKGFHFVQSPYVEYNHNGQFLKEQEMVEKITTEIDKLMQENGKVHVEVVPYDRAGEVLGTEVPSYLTVNQPIRIVTYGSISCPCSGTHVNTFDQIGKQVIIKSAKKKGDKVRISYSVKNE